MQLKIFKKKNKGIPDIGKEEEFDRKKRKKQKSEAPEEEEEEEEEESAPPKVKQPFIGASFETEKIDAKIGSLEAMVKGYGERISVLNQQIGELRSMNLSSEKSISKISMEASKAVDIVKEVKPEKLRIDYQRLDAKTEELREKIDTGRQFMETILNELKDVRRKVGTFVGTDALLKLSEDVKKDLVETQRLLAKIRLHADKSEQIFIELKDNFMESKKTSEIISNLDSSYSGIQKDVEKLRLDFSKIISSSDFNSFQKSVNNKFVIVEKAMLELTKISEENERLGRLIETILAREEKNKNDIADIAMAIGDDHIKSVGDYNDRLVSIIEIVDSLAGQVLEVKKIIGMEPRPKKLDMTKRKDVIKKDRLDLKHMKVHPEISEKLAPAKPEIPSSIKRIRDYAAGTKPKWEAAMPRDEKSFEEKIMDLRIKEERSPYDILGEKVAEKIRQVGGSIAKDKQADGQSGKKDYKQVDNKAVFSSGSLIKRLNNIRQGIKMLSVKESLPSKKRKSKSPSPEEKSDANPNGA